MYVHATAIGVTKEKKKYIKGVGHKTDYTVGIGYKGLKSRVDQNTLLTCIKFSNNKLKCTKIIIPYLL